MNNYLVPLNRYQFAQFYRYGYTYIPKSTLLEFDGQFSETTKQNLADHFSVISPFEYDEEYLILHLIKVAETLSDNILFEVQEIVAIYPLSKQAKISIQEKIDQRIKLSEPIFESVLPIIESGIQKKEIQKAIDALWQICDIEGNKEELLSLIGIDNIFKGLDYRKEGVSASKLKGDNFWSILISYNRYSYFPKTTLGLFYDVGEVYSFYKGKSDGVIGTKIYEVLDNINKVNPSNNFPAIIKELEANSLAAKFINDINVISENRFNPLIASALFIRWKNELQIPDVPISETTIFNKKTKQLNFLNDYPKEVKVAIILIASFYGFKRFYDTYYDKLNLRFYKSYSPKQEIQIPIDKLKVNTKAEIELQKDVVEGYTGPSTKEADQQVMKASIIEETEAQKDQIFDESSLEKSLDFVEISRLSAFIEKDDASKTTEEPNEIEITKIAAEPKAAIKSTNHKENNDFKLMLLEIIQEKGETTVTELAEELHLRGTKKMNNKAIENLVQDSPEIELFKVKRTNKVRLKSEGLFKT